ncbi:MAG TPA: alpha/beta hydrolase [Streptosporangiaceae bacterium]|nr:alpha/beta hydrolase [Streptosporangiaceae bacterium]
MNGHLGNVVLMGEEYKVDAGGVSLACQASGDRDAPPMVLLHALGEQAGSWAPVTARFAAHYRVVAVDLRGHGRSDWPGAYSFQLMRDDVTALIDRLGLGKVVLAGHSMGGMVAYLTAMTRPDQVSRLIVEDASPPCRRDRALPGRPDGPLDFDWPVVPAIVGQVNQGDPVTWGKLGEISAPTLLIGGGPQSHIPQQLLADVASRIPSCELVTIPAGHYVHNTKPDEFADTVLRWLRG